jgi:hypothetical protein
LKKATFRPARAALWLEGGVEARPANVRLAVTPTAAPSSGAHVRAGRPHQSARRRG